MTESVHVCERSKLLRVETSVYVPEKTKVREGFTTLVAVPAAPLGTTAPLPGLAS